MPSDRQLAAKKYAANQCRLYRSAYDYGECQISHLLRKSDEFRVWERRHCLPSLEVHHIYSRRHLEGSHFTALILLENAAHDFAHDAGVREFNAGHAVEICCLTVKRNMSIQELGREHEPDQSNWDLATLGMICGYSTFWYRLEMLANSLAGTPYDGMAGELLETI